ncbi:MAG: (d)CMP kinase [Clostridiales bacterium]|jgi:cytidylate kinase|nr:(d)CMP kinase [Clostridiales bacterium]
MGKIFRIAIDGPSGAGKSTIAKRLALELAIDYIDTGAMYRAVAYKMMSEGISVDEVDKIKSMLESTHIDFAKGETILDGEIISDKIRTPEISELASDVSALPVVREKLVKLQREMGKRKSVVMDGRDIGTNVFPDAEFKFFLTASVKERARRRWNQLKEMGKEIDITQVEADIIKRDHNDSTRKINPLQKAKDAVELDSTTLSIKEVTDFILNIVRPSL